MERVYPEMKSLILLLQFLALASLILAGTGLIIYYILELVSTFFVISINMVKLDQIIWRIIYICFGCSLCAFLLAHFLDR